MTYLTKAQLIPMLEAMAPGQELAFRFSPTFGSCHAVILANPSGEGKRYIMYYGIKLDVARDSKPLWRANRAAKVAVWLADSNPVLVDAPMARAQAV